MLNSDGNENAKKGVLSKKKTTTFHGRTDGRSCDCQIFWHLLVTIFLPIKCAQLRGHCAPHKRPLTRRYIGHNLFPRAFLGWIRHSPSLNAARTFLFSNLTSWEYIFNSRRSPVLHEIMFTTEWSCEERGMRNFFLVYASANRVLEPLLPSASLFLNLQPGTQTIIRVVLFSDMDMKCRSKVAVIKESSKSNLECRLNTTCCIFRTSCIPQCVPLKSQLCRD